MANKSKFIKSLLTSASAATLVLGAASSASAALWTTNNPGTTVANGVAPANATRNPAGAANFANGDAILINGAGHSVQVTAATEISSIRVNAAPALVGLDIDQNTSVGSIVSEGGTAANRVNADVADGVTLTLTGKVGGDDSVTTVDVYSGLNGITLNGANSVLAVNLNSGGSITLDGSINGNAANDGTINLTKGGVTFNGAIGATKAVKAIDIAADASAVFNKSVATQNGVKIAAGRSAVFNASSNTAVNLDGADATVTIGSNVTLTGNIDNVSTADNAGKVVFDQGNAVVAGQIGATKAVAALDVGNSSTATVEVADTKAQVINLKNDSTLKLTANANLTVANGLKNDSGEENKGVLQVQNGNNTFAGAIGSSDAAIRKVQFDNVAAALEVTGPGIWAQQMAPDAGNVAKGVLQIKGDATNGNFMLATSTSGAGIDELRIDVKGGAAGATNATIKGVQKYASIDFLGAQDHKLILEGDGTILEAQNLTFARADQLLELNEGTTFKRTDGANGINGNGANEGIIQVKGNATLDSVVGQNKAANQILFDDEGKTLTSNAIQLNLLNGIVFNKKATLDLTKDNESVALTSVVVAGDAIGSIKANNLRSGKTLSVGNIGDTATNKRLELLEVTSGADISLTGTNTAITRVNIGSQDNTTTFGTAANNAQDVYVGEFAGEDKKGTVKFLTAVGGTTTLKAGSKLGSADRKRKAIMLDAGNANNTTLILEDGVNIYASEGMKNLGAGLGVLNFKGDSIVDAAVGANNTFNAITVEGDGKTVSFLQNVNLANGAANNITVHNNATAKFRGNVTGKNINGNIAGQGNVEFNNTDAASIDIVVGATSLNSVLLSGGNLTFKQDVNAGVLKFSSESEMSATFETAGALAATKFETTAGTTTDNRRHNIVLEGTAFTANNNGLTLGQAVGTEANQFGFVKINKSTTVGANDVTLTVNNPSFYADALTGANNTNNLVFAANGGRARSIGKSGEQFLLTTFNDDTTIEGNVWSKDVSLLGNAQVRFGGNVTSVGGAATLGAGSTADFDKDGAIVDVDIRAAAGGNGVVNFAGSAEIKQRLGSTAIDKINFNGGEGKKIIAAQDLSANEINFKASEFAPSANLTLAGKSSFDGTTLNLSDKQLTLTNAANMSSEIKGAATLSVTVSSDGSSAGQLLVDGNSSALDMAQITALTINVSDSSQLTNNNSYVLVSGANGGQVTSAANNIVANIKDNTNGFVAWSYDNASNTLSRKDNSATRLSDILSGTTQQNTVSAITGDNVSGDAAKLISETSKIQKDGVTDTAKIKELYGRLDNSAALSNARISQGIHQAGSNVVNTRAATVSSQRGAAAGDEHLMNGAWLMPFYNNIDQDARSNTPGYKASSYGVTVGADTQVNADMMLGLAFTYAKTDVKHKGVISGDKTKGDSYLFSVYGVQQLTNEWFLQGNVTAGSTRFKTQQKRLTAGADETAKGKFDSAVFGGELLAGYDFRHDNMVVTPMFGASYSRQNDGGYNESGTSFQNLRVKRKASSTLEAIAGAKVQFATFNTGDMDVSPEVHGFVRHDLLKNEQAVQLQMNGANSNLSNRKPKNNHTFYNAGVGLVAKQDDYEFGVNYDATFASKYVGHQGSLKVRMNF